MKVLISAYACEPHRGSEPEIGWQWAIHLSRHCDVTVITRSNNRESIEAEVKHLSGTRLRFVYHDLASRILSMKSALGSVGVYLYYFLWQAKTRKLISEMVDEEEFDVLHHLTFGSYRLPFAVSTHGVPSVVGSVGGCEKFLPQLMPSRPLSILWREHFRNFLTDLSCRYGIGMARYRKVDKVFASSLEMREVFRTWGVEAEVVPQIGIERNMIDRLVEPGDSNKQGFRLLFVGNILYWKGIEIAVQVLASLPDEVTLTFVGDGPDVEALAEVVRELGLEQRVFMLGRKPRADVLKLYSEYDLFFYPSIHDSGAFTVLEAMAAGLPVVCLGCGGPAISVNDECGTVVKAGSRVATISRLRDAVSAYSDNNQMLIEKGLKAQARIRDDYDWERKAIAMVDHYRDIT